MMLPLLLPQVAAAQDERDEAVKAREAAVRERDSTLNKVRADDKFGAALI